MTRAASRSKVTRSTTSQTALRRMSFSAPEYRRRVCKIQDLMVTEGLSALVVSDLSNICYLCGFQTIGSYGYGVYALVVPKKGKPILFASDFESHNAKIYGCVDDVVVYSVGEQLAGSPIKRLAALIRERGLAVGRIGCERLHYGLTFSQFLDLSSTLVGVEWVESGHLIQQAKIIKSDAEITVMRQAAQLTSKGMSAGVEVAVEGNYDNAIGAAVYNAIISGGGEYFSLQPIVTVGRRSGVPHSTFHRNRLNRHDSVFIEVSASWERYSAPALRSLCVGKPVADVRRATDACRASVRTLKDALRDGASSQHAARLAGRALRAIEKRLVWHGFYGYSVGLTFPPMCTDCGQVGIISETADFEVQAGMVFHINTSLRKIGAFGVTMGDTVVVTKSGCEVLTGIPLQGENR